jgi:hypothetical protein
VTKDVTISDGTVYQIAPLTVRQVKSLFTGERPKETAAIFDENLATIATALNNAAGTNQYSAEGLQDLLTLPDLKAIHAEVLAISGLTAGEATAAKA